MSTVSSQTPTAGYLYPLTSCTNGRTSRNPAPNGANVPYQLEALACRPDFCSPPPDPRVGCQAACRSAACATTSNTKILDA